MLYLHANVHKAGHITENKFNSQNVITTGNAQQRPASGVGIKTAILLR
jgi:hypothetical protein